MEWIQSAFEHIPEAAASPLAFVAYAFALAAGVFTSWQIGKRNSDLKLIDSLPKKDRDARVEQIIGRPLPNNLTGDQWLRHQRSKLVFFAFAIVCVTLVIIFAIAVSRADRREAPAIEPVGPTNESVTILPSQNPEPHDVDLLKFIQLRGSQTFVRDKFGSPIWSSKAQPYGLPKTDVFRMDEYDLAVGYDDQDHVSMFSIVPTSKLFFTRISPVYDGFQKTLAELDFKDFLGFDFSAKFFYYAEGVRGGSEADGHRTYGYFQTSDGVDREGRAGQDFSFMAMSDAASKSDGTIPNVPGLAKWRQFAHPNGYFENVSETTIEPFFLHDYDWTTSVPPKS